MTTPLPAEPGTAEAAALAGNGPQQHGRLGGPDLRALAAAAQERGETAAKIRAAFRPDAPVPDAPVTLPEKPDGFHVADLPLP